MLPFGPEPFVLSPAVKNVNDRIYKTIRFEVFTAVTMKNTVFRDVYAVWIL
jgi:hypothetical protein